VSSLPSAMRMHNGMLKYLLKKVAADLLPVEILTRGKQGFSPPFEHWFRGELANYAHELLDSPRTRQRGIFDPLFIRSLLHTHALTRQMNYSRAIWILLCLVLWFQVYMDTPPLYVDHGLQPLIA